MNRRRYDDLDLWIAVLAVLCGGLLVLAIFAPR